MRDCGLIAPLTSMTCSSTPARAKRFMVELCRVVVTQLADVAGAHAPLLAGDNGGGNLATGKNCDRLIFRLRAAFRILGQGDHGVGGI